MDNDRHTSQFSGPVGRGVQHLRMLATLALGATG
jgi:hypothetical protein